MRKTLCLLVILLLVAGSTCWAQEGAKKKPKKKPKPTGIEIVDPAAAAKDPDFGVQGEYVGEAVNADGSREKVGAQVVARSKGEFEIYLLAGGLPGAGWKKGDTRGVVTGKRDGEVTSFEGEMATGEIRGDTMTVECKQTNGKATLTRVERASKTLAAKPPENAIVLFDGTHGSQFENAVLSEDGNLVANTVTKEKFNDFRLHLEFRLSWKPWATGQARSNSGVYLHDCYEVQVLDSFGLEGADNECAGLYKVKAPDVNMCLPPLVWQTYDIQFTAPKYDESGTKTQNARLTVRHNGVLVHDDIELPHDTPGRQQEGPGPRPIYLQGHGNRVQYRNIWLAPQ